MGVTGRKLSSTPGRSDDITVNVEPAHRYAVTVPVSTGEVRHAGINEPGRLASLRSSEPPSGGRSTLFNRPSPAE